jgi:hypothetical protein
MKELRQPTTLKRLEELTSPELDQLQDENAVTDTEAWLEWTLAFLQQRKLYHKKAYIRKAILERMAKTLLSKDELAVIDQEAEKQLSLKEANIEIDETEEVPE